jgi:hypothetical protein
MRRDLPLDGSRRRSPVLYECLGDILMDGPLTPRREETAAGFSSVPQGKRRWNS